MDILQYIFLLILIIGLLISSFKKKKCDICGTRFSEKEKKHYWEIDGKNTIICSKCNRKLENQEHKRKFDEYFQGTENEYDYEPPTVNRLISTQTKNAVWRRDGGRCIECGSQERLEYDHIIPVSKGGSNTERNIQLLCEKCNRKKSDKIQ
jgi:hypothetical protein